MIHDSGDGAGATTTNSALLKLVRIMSISILCGNRECGEFLRHLDSRNLDFLLLSLPTQVKSLQPPKPGEKEREARKHHHAAPDVVPGVGSADRQIKPPDRESRDKAAPEIAWSGSMLRIGRRRGIIHSCYERCVADSERLFLSSIISVVCGMNKVQFSVAAQNGVR